jgi:hypothetical protein
VGEVVLCLKSFEIKKIESTVKKITGSLRKFSGVDLPKHLITQIDSQDILGHRIFKHVLGAECVILDYDTY